MRCCYVCFQDFYGYNSQFMAYFTLVEAVMTYLLLFEFTWHAYTQICNNRKIAISELQKMSSQKPHLYTLRLLPKTLQANCQRASCRVHLSLKIHNQQRKLKQSAEMRKNVATFAGELVWEDVMFRYEEVSGTYLDLEALVTVCYETSEPGKNGNKLKVGQVTVNLAKLLNTKTYRITTLYPLEKCYDPNAKLKMAIDLTQSEQPEPASYTRIEYQQQDIAGDMVRGGLRQSAANWKVSKIREKMVEDQRALLQDRLYQYEERMERYRGEANEQVKRLNEQMERKDERIASLSAQVNSLTQALQQSQLQLQKSKSKQSSLQKQVITLQQQLRQQSSTLSQQTLSLQSKSQQLEQATAFLQQLEQSKDKKQQHYKQELQKYLARYTESENARNRVVFQMEARLRDELKKKEDYYGELVAKLEARLRALGESNKEAITKKDRELVIISEKCTAVEKQLNITKLKLTESEQHSLALQDSITSLTVQLNKSLQRTKSLQSQSQLSSHSSSTLTQKLHSLQSQSTLQSRQINQLQHQLQMANKTIEDQQASIMKLNRNIKMYQEREYYMEEKYQGELEAKSENVQAIMGSVEYWRNMARKLEVRVRFLEEKVEDGEAAGTVAEKERARLQEEIKNNNRQLFENGHQILRLQSQNKRLSQSLQQLQAQSHQKDLQITQLTVTLSQTQSSLSHSSETHLQTIASLEARIKELNQKMLESESQWEEQFFVENEEKNGLLADLEAQVQRMRDAEGALRIGLADREARVLTLEGELQAERDKVRGLDREIMKLKFQLTKLGDQKQGLAKEEMKLKSSVSQLKSQVSALKSQSQKLSRTLNTQKQSYTEVLKWLLNRSWDSSREYLQQAGPQIDLQLITFINTGLQRLYGTLEKNARLVEQLREENQKIVGQLARNRLEVKYEEEFQGRGKEKGYLVMEYGWEGRADVDRDHERPSNISSSYEVSKLEELKVLNGQLQRDFSNKLTEIQNLNEELFQERTKARQLADQASNLKQQLEDLNLTLTKKNSQIANLQAQLSQRQIDMSSFSSNFNTRSPARNIDYKSEAESKFKQQKMIAELQRKLEELDRQNTLQKSKIELLEGRAKVNSQKMGADGLKIANIERLLKQKEESLRRVTKDNEEKEGFLDKVRKELELALSKLSKKEVTIEEMKVQIEQQRKINEILAKEVEEWQTKFTQKQRRIELQSHQNQKALLETTETLALQKLQKQKQNLQQGAQISTLRSSVKQLQRRITSLEGLLQKSKSQNEELYARYLKLLNEKNQLEEMIKDMRMNQVFVKQGFEKGLTDLKERLQGKEFELEELRFSSQSKIMELEKQLQEQAIIQY